MVDTLTIESARLRGAGLVRADVERWLALMPVDALGLGPNEILHISRLPIVLRSDPRSEPRKSAEAVLNQLRIMTESAERDPLRSRAGAAACRFSSRAHYLAWLVGLWLGGASGRAAAVAATGAASLGKWQRRELLCDGPILVAVTARLAQTGMAVAWMARFEPRDYELAEVTLSRSFHVELRPPDANPAAGSAGVANVAPGPSRPARPPAVFGALVPRPDVAGAEVAAIAGALARIGAHWQQLPPRGRVLFLATAVLSRAPGRIVLPGYVPAILQAAAEPGGIPALPGSASASVADRPLRPEPAHRLAAPTSLADDSPSPDAGRSLSEPFASVRDEVSRPPRRAFASAADLARSGQPAPKPRPGVEHAHEAAPNISNSFSSEFAGLLFLLNAFVALELYPDFAGSASPRLAAPPLYLIDRIGLAWFAAAYRRDPLHRWINENSFGGPLPRDWRVEPGWCDSWPRARAVLHQRDGRLTLWHAAGFPLADTASHRACAIASRQKAPGLARRGTRLRRLPIAREHRWALCLALFLDARIRAATGCREMGLASLALPGEVSVDGLDLTARFPLDRHPVPLRLAGLDRDPCWQPAEGRSFRFHFS